MARTTPAPTPPDRVASAAAQEGVGPWLSSFVVNSRREGSWLVTGVIALLVAVGGIVGSAWLDMPWPGRLVLIVVLVLVGLFGLFCAVIGSSFRRSGRWIVHRHEHGLVMERTRGAVLAVRYDRAAARLFGYVEPGDSTSEPIPHVGLELTLPDGTVCAMAEPESGNADALRALGAALGAAEPAALDYREAIEKLSDQSWGGL